MHSLNVHVHFLPISSIKDEGTFLYNSAQIEVYSMQHYVITFVNDHAAVRWFSPGPPVYPTNKTYRHDINEILLNVALNTINPNPAKSFNIVYKKKA